MKVQRKKGNKRQTQVQRGIQTPRKRFPYRTKTGRKLKKRRFKKRPLILEELSLETVIEEPADGSEIYPNPDIIGQNADVYCVKLDKDGQALLQCVIGEDLLVDRNWKYVLRKTISIDIEEKNEDSQFYIIKEAVEASHCEHVLVMFDKNLEAYYLFISVNPLSELHNLAVKTIKSLRWVKRGFRNRLRRVRHFRSRKAKIIARTLIRQRLTVSRTRIKVICYGFWEAMELRELELSSVEAEDLHGGYINNLMRKRPSEEDVKVVRQRTDSDEESEEEDDWAWGVRDFNVQSLPKRYSIYIQTFPAGISNKGAQKRFACIKKKKYIYRTYGNVLLISDACMEFLSLNLKENYRTDLCADRFEGHKGVVHKYKSGKTKVFLRGPLDLGQRRVLNMGSFLRRKYKIILDYRRYESISCIAWHPRFMDFAAVAYRGYIHVGKHHYLEGVYVTDVFEEENFPDYEIILWNLKEDPEPVRIIYCDCEMRHLQYNMDYPSLLAGSNTCGQIILWDMNIYPIIESVFISYMASLFPSITVPWIYIPPSIAYITVESCDMYSHRDDVFDMQWVPSNSRMTIEGSIDVSGKVRSGLIVTASGDGTVGVWNFQMVHPISKPFKSRKLRLSKTSPDVPAFPQYDRHMQPVKYVLSIMNKDPVPVTAVSVNNMRQWVVPGRHRTNYMSYKSMRNALITQRPMMHACITAGLGDGHIIGMFPDYQYYIKREAYEDPSPYKDLYWLPRNDSHMQYQCFKHDSRVLCLKRSHFADDVILSVSESSFCVWKEQSRLQKERRKNMPWLQSWFSEEAHEAPPEVRMLPILWKKEYRQLAWYMNGEWSPLRASQFYLLVSSGEVEIYDVAMPFEVPYMTVYVGADTIHSVVPYVCSTRVDEIGFVEDELLYSCKVPDGCKHRRIIWLKDLQKFASHEAWRRCVYHAWCQQYYQENEELVQKRTADIQRIIRARRFTRIKRLYELVRLRKAKAKKAERKFKDRFQYMVPNQWWSVTKWRNIQGYIQRKKNFMRWFTWDDIIDGLADEDLILFDKVYEPRNVAFKDYERTKAEWVKIRIHHACNEFFQLYWDIRYEQAHMYDHLYVADVEEDTAIANNVFSRSEHMRTYAPIKQRYYGMVFELAGHYEAEKVRDLGRIKERLGRLKFGGLETFVCRTMFTRYLSSVYKKNAIPAYPKLMHDYLTPDYAPVLNSIWRLMAVLDLPGFTPKANLPQRTKERKDAFDITDQF